MNTGMNYEIFKAMQDKEPYASYIKTVLARVYVEVLDPFGDAPIGLILFGDPQQREETCIVDVWTDKQDIFLKNRNKKHFDTGTLIKYDRPKEVVKERTMEEFSDEELLVVINYKFLALQKALNSTTSVPVLFRILNLARQAEKSEKIIAAIQARLSEVQATE